MARPRQQGGTAASGRAGAARPPLTDRLPVKAPLDALAFLLPWIVFYEAGLLLLQPSDSLQRPDRVVAFHLIEVFFALFGTTGVLLPGLAVVVILIAAHAASRQPWRVHKRAVMWMYAESLALAVPLLLFNQAFAQMTAAGSPAARPWLGEVTMCIGAGIYEELVFRLILIPLLVIVGVDLLRLPRQGTTLAAILIAAAFFAAHHHPPIGSEVFVLKRFLFRAAAGTYLGSVFVYRGYGAAAGLHIIYNLLVVTLGY